MAKIIKALRQYRSNSADKFIMGYDVEVVDKAVSELEQALHHLIICAESNTGHEPSVSCMHRAIDEAKEILNKGNKSDKQR